MFVVSTMWCWWWCKCWWLIVGLLLVVGAQGPGPGPGRKRSSDYGFSTQMQSRAVDTRVTLKISEGLPKDTHVGYIPTKPGYTYRFNEASSEFTLNPSTGEIKTKAVLDREALQNNRYDLVILSSQPTYPIEVSIIVLDINDNPPEFPEPVIAVSFSENAAEGSHRPLDAATDKDEGINGVSDDYRIIAGNKNEKFKLNVIVTENPEGNTSYLYLETTGQLDREEQGFYVLNISARDGGTSPKYGYLQVNVTILDVNDNPPLFDQSDYRVSLNESVPPGTKVLQVMASDDDFGDNAKITYYLADTERQFTIDPETGTIYTTEILDCPQQKCQGIKPSSSNCTKTCVFTVFARDHGTPRQDGRTYVTVSLVDANDHDPIISFRYFSPTVGFATVDENAESNSVVAAVFVNDTDQGLNGETTVKIVSGNELKHFRLDYLNIVRVNGVLDREEISKYNLTVVATDKGTPPRTATAFLIIHVNDVNDHEPVFEKSEYRAVLSELAPPGSYVAGITATDADTGVNAQIFYAIVTGNEWSWFEINYESGLITTKGVLDREIQGVVELNISAKDGGPNPKKAHTLLKVTILDENDEAPEFSQSLISISLSEDSSQNSFVTMLTAIDRDQGTNGSVTYSLHSVVHQRYPDTFLLDSQTGNLTTKRKLDREKIANYEILVIAKDQGIPPQSSTATVLLNILDVNDNNPEFYPQKYFAAISEDTKINSSILKLFATDSDIGENAMLTYKLESGSDGLFSVDPWSGVIYLRGNLATSPKNIFRISVSVRDRGEKRAIEDASVEIVKESKLEEVTFANDRYEFQILENQDATVGKVHVNVSDSVTYSIIRGDPKNNFHIDERDGIIRTTRPIDREENNDNSVIIASNKVDVDKTVTYSLTVIARSGLLYGKTEVTVIVLDLNDNKPIFLSDKEDIKLPENAAVGQEVYLSKAIDLDSGVNSRVTYTLTYNPDEQFRISETTGVIYLNKPIRAEPSSVLHIKVTAADGGKPKLFSEHSFMITIEDVNDHTPVFDHTSYETSLPESTAVNERFFALSASDADQGLNGRISYTISEGNVEGKFGIFPDGYLYVRKALDREDKDYYSLTVTARDLGNPSRSSIVPVVVHVIDENDNAPEFTNTTFSFNIREGEPIDSFVGKLTANDKDIGRNAELIFSLPVEQNNFTIDPKNGFIKSLNVFDRESLVQSTGQNYITFEATVTDNGRIRLEDKVKVNVHITDVNDNPPEFLKAPYKVQISEGAPLDASVVKLYTTDADEGLNGDVFYLIKGGNDDGKFGIIEATGQIYLAKSLDRETTSKYTLTVVAHDAGPSIQMSSSATVYIDILDENDNAPEFTQTDTMISVIETTPVGTELIQFQATDRDLGVNSEVMFAITAGNRKDTFRIDSTSGVLSLNKPLDYEELSGYTLNITAFDNGNTRLSTTISFSISIVDANDNPPAFPNTALVRQIPEGIPVPTPIVTVTAEDSDSGINGNVTYSISHQEPDDNNRHFDINPITGVIHTILPIDREEIDTFRLTVVATDSAQPLSNRLSAEKLVTIIVEDINDNAPIFVSMKAAVLPFYQGRSLVPIMHIYARDLDSETNGRVTYDLVSGNTDLFHLYRNNGTLMLKRRILNPEPRYQLAVKATDEAVQHKSTDEYITVIAASEVDSGPIFNNESFFGSVYENEPSGTNILNVSARFDGDIEYYVTNITGGGVQVDRLFEIDMKLGSLSTVAELDREIGVDTYEVEVYAIAAHGIPRTSSTKVRVTVKDKNDSPPSFKDTPLRFNVSEDFSPGLNVTTIRAYDPDTLGQLQYSLISGGDNHFALDSETGNLTLIDFLDRETKEIYKLTVRANDGIQSTDTTVIIQVTDTNDNPPAFLKSAYSFDIEENAPRGTKVGSIEAIDADLDANGQLTYTVISDWANDVFSLNPQTGDFTLTAKLDYEEVQHYILDVQAQDSGQPSLSSTLTVYCNVVDINDNAPIFDPMSYSNEVLENVPIYTHILSVSATDLDSGNNGKIVYSITSGDENNTFGITGNGSIYTKRELDRETQDTYILVVTASDQAPPGKILSSTVQVVIVLKDINDMAPEFVSINETSVRENININAPVMQVKAQDKDEGRNGYVEYYLTEDESSRGTFSLGPVDGLLKVAKNIDRELKSSYTLFVTAKDRGDPPKSSQTQILVKVLDENDNSPVFDPKQYSASIPENASIGASVLQVSATDIDEGLNGRVRYSISSGDINRDFSIAEDTGIVRVAKNLNYERKSHYVLIVRAEDCARDKNRSAVRSDTAEISISVSDINDNPPTFLDSPYLAYVMENVIPPNGGYVITVQAYDADTPPFNSLVRYFIKEGDTDNFRINASTGEISLLRALDREEQAEYTLSLVAMDTGSPPLTGTGTVKIIIRDVNDHSPEFKRQSYKATIAENSQIGSKVITPIATDKDEGLNAKIRYTLSGDKVDRFRINQDTGEVVTVAVLDREENDEYQLILRAQDCSPIEPRATMVNLTITVIDENDNSPAFSSPEYEVYIPYDTKIGQFVFGARATDQDIGSNSKITYSLHGRDAGKFTINRESGVIKAAVDLSRGYIDMYTVEIEAKDGGRTPRRTSAELKVFLKASKLFPIFESPLETNFKLAENVEKGKLITTLRARSPKQTPSNSIRFSIAGGNIGDALKINEVNGAVQIGGKGLDYETSTQYEVWVEARDSDNPPLRSVISLTINVTDANDNAPRLDSALYNATILEEEPPGELVVILSATDDDSNENGQIMYRLVDDFEETFEITSDTGEIYTRRNLDREYIPFYELVVEAVDQGTPQLSGSATVLVTVLDKNDNPPRFTRLFSVNVTENADPGSFVIKVTSSDQDIGENANATYSFTENPGGNFKIDPISGNVTVVGLLDREQQDEYLLKVAAVDDAWKAETPLTITIQDQNDNAPEFEHSYYSFNFPELQRDIVFVGQVMATDRDKQGPNSVISYSLQQPSDLFTVDPASGEIFSKRSLKYKYTQLESSPENMYSLTVLAIDNGKPPMSSECLVTVNIVDANNNAPQFEELEYLSPVPVDAAQGQRVLKVTANDKLDFGINAEINYSIVYGNGSEYFIVEKTNGWITVNKKVNVIGDIFLVTVRATDKGVPPQHDEVNITLIVTGDNEYSPSFTVLSYQVLVPENEMTGRSILRVSASDHDEGPNGMIRYTISGGNEGREFIIDPIYGNITNLQPLDYDIIQEYYLNVTAQDLGFKPRKTTAMVTITLTDINDNAPEFNQSFYSASIAENLPAGSYVCQVFATDKDSPKNAIIRYSITGGSGKGVFHIDQRTGNVTAKISFDYEENNVYNLTIMAANPNSSMFGTTTLTVYITGVNEYYPRFIQPVFHFDVSESSEVGTSIGTIQATDQDSGEDGQVYYLFGRSSNDKGFVVNSETGVISVSRNLDRETQSRVLLTVLAKNAGGIRGNDTDEAEIIVSIQDGNDPPEFLQKLYEAKIPENATIGSFLLTVKAVDNDTKLQNKEFSYSIIGGNTDHAFKIGPKNGKIETAKNLDRETIPKYVLTVGGIDMGNPPETGSTTVVIDVTDINDNGPIFDPLPVGKIYENEPPNTKIMKLSATDPDLPPNGAPFNYRLVDGRPKNYVKIDRNGDVFSLKSIDREITPELNIVVEVEDNGIPRNKSKHHIKIEVLDRNDSPSSSRSVHVFVHSFNNTYPLGKIADVRPNDPDINGDYKCRILQSPSGGPSILSIPFNCNLHTSRIIPNQGYSLKVSGNDGKHKDVTSEVTVQFLSFDNATIDNSVTIRISNLTADQFLANDYQNFVDILKTIFTSEESVTLYGLNENKNNLELTLAVKSSNGYREKSYVSEKIRRKKSALKKLFETNELDVNYLPCSANTCENGGVCTESIIVRRNTKITNSQNIVFTSPDITHDYHCQCADGFTGQNCNKRQNPCLPNPCKADGQCRIQGYNVQCICPRSRDGRFCELEKGDACSANPCQNGGRCGESKDGSSFFCVCRPGYRGNQCEDLEGSCRPNPCLYGGLCVSLKPGYKCSCTDGRYGKHCENSTYGFRELSYMSFSPMNADENDIIFIFATTKPNALLVYNYGLQTGGRSDFIALEILNGKAVFSFGGARTAITSVSVGGSFNNLADGNWHKITAARKGKILTLSVADCTDHGDNCNSCERNDCYAHEIGSTSTLNFNNHPLLIGGINSTDSVIRRPGQINSNDFVGCIHSVKINGLQLNLSNPIRFEGIEHTCIRSGSCTDKGRNKCYGFGECIDRWNSVSCVCGNQLVAPNCDSAIQPVTLHKDGYIEFIISAKFRRMQLLEFNPTTWMRDPKLIHSAPSKSISFVFKTMRGDGILFYATSNEHFTSVELRNGQIIYLSMSTIPVNMTSKHSSVTDGLWHNLTLHLHSHGLQILLDGARIGDELDTTDVHDFLDPYLNYLSLGGARFSSYYADNKQPIFFEGCMANFSINNEIQPFNGSGSVFSEVTLKGTVMRDCKGSLGLGAIVAPDPLSIGITLVIVFFIVLLVAILVSFVVFRLRKQNKEKGGAPGSPAKQNGGNTIMGSNGLMNSVNDSVLSRSMHGNENSMYHSENGDVIRGMSGLPIVGPELLSKKFKEREIMQGEVPRPQRPDIIEREVVTKSPPMREDHHPPLPPSNNHTHDHVPNDLNTELLPEHYDLENASSIAPSDIDIVYHYKGYREAAGVRKFKAPAPVSSYHHKHTSGQAQGQHRHSPHHPTAFPPRAPPVTNPASRTHQSTPLARLSPSSEMSAQQPRILTLHDISGKPLQSALLATTSSSGGVGKDVLHSNSERSLNSPVMSQLSGQSSNSRKASVPPPVTSASPGMGLTAEEIERLNSRPRTSSLVSTLDAVSSSSEAPRGTVSNHLNHMHHSPVPETHHSSSTTDESGNDSFTCSEIEYDNASLAGDKYKPNEPETRRSNSSSSNKNNVPPPSYDGFDSSYRGSMSTLVASDDELGGPMYRPQAGSPGTAALGWDYLLNWGPNFESLAGVFKDIAELPDSVNGRVSTSLRLTNASKPSEEYV